MDRLAMIPPGEARRLVRAQHGHAGAVERGARGTARRLRGRRRLVERHQRALPAAPVLGIGGGGLVEAVEQAGERTVGRLAEGAAEAERQHEGAAAAGGQSPVRLALPHQHGRAAHARVGALPPAESLPACPFRGASPRATATSAATT